MKTHQRQSALVILRHNVHFYRQQSLYTVHVTQHACNMQRHGPTRKPAPLSRVWLVTQQRPEFLHVVHFNGTKHYGKSTTPTATKSSENDRSQGFNSKEVELNSWGRTSSPLSRSRRTLFRLFVQTFSAKKDHCKKISALETREGGG
jgi:hypothetical protein